MKVIHSIKKVIHSIIEAILIFSIIIFCLVLFPFFAKEFEMRDDVEF